MSTQIKSCFTLTYINFRVPLFNDLYIDKNNHVQRCKSEHTSKNSRPKIIVRENWDSLEFLTAQLNKLYLDSKGEI